MQVLAMTVFKIRYFNNDSILFEVYNGNIACIHCGCYDGRSIEGNEYFNKAEKSTISKIQNLLTKNLANGVTTLNDNDPYLFEVCQVNNHCFKARCISGEFALKRD